MKKILITGGSGFIGSFVVEEALRQGLETWVAVRRTSSREYLRDERIRFIEPNLGNYTELCRQLEEHKREHGTFDYVVHCAGVTKCADEADFERVNTGHTENLVNALRQTGMVPRRLVYLSSLSVMGPVNDRDYRPISQDDEPQPNTAYARSKLKAERFLQEQKDFPCVILRPTGVYGPREKDYFLMAQSIARHVDCSVGFRRQDLTFIYVKDVVQAVFLALEHGRDGGAYFLSDGAVYSSRTFSDLIWEELGHPFLIRLRLPLWVLWTVSEVAGRLAAWRRKSSTLNPDKYKIMKQRNWRCDITPSTTELGYHPQYGLERGVKETIAWYKKEGWI